MGGFWTPGRTEEDPRSAEEDPRSAFDQGSSAPGTEAAYWVARRLPPAREPPGATTLSHPRSTASRRWVFTVSWCRPESCASRAEPGNADPPRSFMYVESVSRTWRVVGARSESAIAPRHENSGAIERSVTARTSPASGIPNRRSRDRPRTGTRCRAPRRMSHCPRRCPPAGPGCRTGTRCR